MGILLLYLYPLNQRLYDTFSPLALRALPLSHLRWAEGEDWKYHFEPFYPFGALWGILLLPCRVPQHGGEFRSNKKSSNKEKRKPTKADRSVTFNPLPLCSCKEYRGSARRARRLEYKQKHKPRSFYPLSFINIQVYPHELSTEPQHQQKHNTFTQP